MFKNFKYRSCITEVDDPEALPNPVGDTVVELPRRRGMGGRAAQMAWDGWKSCQNGVGWVEELPRQRGMGGRAAQTAWDGWKSCQDGVGWVEELPRRRGMGGRAAKTAWHGGTPPTTNLGTGNGDRDISSRRQIESGQAPTEMDAATIHHPRERLQARHLHLWRPA